MFAFARRSVLLKALLVAVWLPGLAALHAAQLRVPSTFADGMVLQREREVAIWGFGTPGQEVDVSGSWGAEGAAVVGDDGRFSLLLATPAAGGPHRLVFESGGVEVLTIEDVWSGEVWLCSGQSNMEWTLGPGVGNGTADWEAEVPRANDTALRLFQVDHALGWAPASDVPARWKVLTPKTAASFSATAYYFGRALRRELDVPVGLLSSNWGGTLIEAWTSAEGLEGEPDFAPDLELIERVALDPAGGAAALESGWKQYWEALPTEPAGAAFDDSAWPATTLPGAWEEAEIGAFDGLVWYRHTFELPAGWEERELSLELGPIDDMDSTWFNGQRVGGLEEAGAWATPRRYSVPAGLARAGTNTIAVRVLDTGGVGGLSGAPEALFLAADDERHSLAGSWRFQRSSPIEELGLPPSRDWLNEDRPSALFNGMIAPLVPFGLRGAIWYQGESNRLRPEQYARLLPGLIADWRRVWGHAFPFYFVQIAPFGYGGDTGEAALLREAQLRSMSVPGTGMAVTMDIGDPADIHPANKRDVGERLARWALRETYGRADVVAHGPVYREHVIEEREQGAALRVRFDHVEGGLTSGGEAVRQVTIAGDDRVFHPAEARIEGDELVAWSPAVARPVALRFGWAADAMTNLWNGAGLPASSFRTDDWDRLAEVETNTAPPVIDAAQPVEVDAHGTLDRVVVIGASVSAGFNLDEDLARVFDETVLQEHEDIRSKASGFFFLNPTESGAEAIEFALEEEATMVLAVDFLFWFGYGSLNAQGGRLADESERLALLEHGLDLLEELECPLVVGDFPDMSDAVGKMLYAEQVPKPETLAALNARVAAWASERPSVVLMPFSGLVERLRSDEAFEIGGFSWPAESSDRMLQSDRLHPELEGLAAVAHGIVHRLVREGFVAKGQVDLDLRAVMGRLGEELDSEDLREL